MQVLAQALDDLHLLLVVQARDRELHHTAHARLVHRDEALVVHVGEEAHDELAVHAIGDAAVAGDAVAEVFDLKGAF